MRALAQALSDSIAVVEGPNSGAAAAAAAALRGAVADHGHEADMVTVSTHENLPSLKVGDDGDAHGELRSVASEAWPYVFARDLVCVCVCEAIGGSGTLRRLSLAHVSCYHSGGAHLGRGCPCDGVVVAVAGRGLQPFQLRVLIPITHGEAQHANQSVVDNMKEVTHTKCTVLKLNHI